VRRSCTSNMPSYQHSLRSALSRWSKIGGSTGGSKSGDGNSHNNGWAEDETGLEAIGGREHKTVVVESVGNVWRDRVFGCVARKCEESNTDETHSSSDDSDSAAATTAITQAPGKTFYGRRPPTRRFFFRFYWHIPQGAARIDGRRA